MEPPLLLPRRRIARLLAATSALVIGAGIAVEIAKGAFGLSGTTGVVPHLSLSYEANLPTWYSSALLLACSLLLAVAAAHAQAKKRPFVARWWILAAGFAFMSADEVMGLHEMAGALHHGSGLLHFGWVVPASAVVLVVAFFYLPFLFSLPRASRRSFFLAGVVYVTGAVLLDLPLGFWTERHGADNLGYALIDAVEESMEILGAQLFLLGLFDHLHREGVSFAFHPSGAP